MGRRRRFTHGAQHQTGARAVEEPDHERRQHDRTVDQRVQREQRLPHHRQIGQAGNCVLGQLGQLGLYIAQTHKCREARAEQRQRQARGVLVGVEPDHQHAEDGSQQGTSEHARTKAHPGIARMNRGRKAGDGGAKHHALGPQVDDAGLFIDQQTQGRQRQHGTGAERSPRSSA